MILENDNLRLLINLIKVQSDTGTNLEKNVEEYINTYLEEMPYFKNNDTFGLSFLPEDPNERAIVWGLVKGNGKETIILLNHHDVVDSCDYGNFQSLAYEPYKLKEALKTLNHANDITDDLNNEEWLFGRGTADMKAGLAIQLNMLSKYSKDSNFSGNILFLSVPDEENLSLGMRNGVSLIKKIKDKYDLNYKLLINSEPHERVNENYTIYDGSVGKTMMTVYIKGKKTHIGKIFEGLNPSCILSRIIVNTELNSDLSDSNLGEISPPPSWSFARDFKENYDASVPEAAGGYISFLTLNNSPKDLIEKLKKISIRSFEETVLYLQQEYKKIYPDDAKIPSYRPNVKLYEELLKDAYNNNQAETELVLERNFKKIKELLGAGRISMPESNFMIIEDLLHIASYNVPTVVIALSPPYYPHISSQKNEEHKKTIDEVMACYQGLHIRKENYFMGISDLSYTGLQNHSEIVPYVAPNMPLWHKDFYQVPFEDMRTLDIPSVIIGPWGKDLHKMTERVYIPDLVKNTVLLIEKLIETLL